MIIIHVKMNRYCRSYNLLYQIVRPDSIDFLFLGSFSDPFQRGERDKKKKKKKEKEAKNCMKMQ